MMTFSELALELNSNGYKNENEEPYSDSEVEDLIRPIQNAKMNYTKDGFGSCGINRDNNPCGDASDY